MRKTDLWLSSTAPGMVNISLAMKDITGISVVHNDEDDTYALSIVADGVGYYVIEGSSGRCNHAKNALIAYLGIDIIDINEL